MDKIDMIRAEIERLKSKYRHNGLWLSSTQSLLAGAKIEAMNELLPFLDSLQQEQQEEPDSKEFTEEFDNYFMPRNREQNGRWGFADIFNLARHFAGWQKEQMLKDAVEGEIQMRYSGCLCAKTIRAINEDKFKLGDKIRIIIVKED